MLMCFFSARGGLYLKIQPYRSERANKTSPFTPAIVEGYNRIYVGNLSYGITEDDLKNLFSDCTIKSIRFGKDKETGEFKCYGHVDFADSESVKTTLKLDQNVVCGRPIRISCALKQGAVTGSTPSQEKTIYNQLKSEDSKPLQENANVNQLNSNDINEEASVPASSKIRRRTCYEFGGGGWRFGCGGGAARQSAVSQTAARGGGDGGEDEDDDDEDEEDDRNTLS